MSNTINEVVCLLPNSSLADQTGRLWNYRNNGGIQFFETGGVFDQPYIKFTDNTIYKNYLYTRTVEDDNKDFRLGDNFTIEFWVRNIATPTKGWCYFIAYHPDNATGSGWAISYRNTDKKIQFHSSSLPTGEQMPVTNTLISAMTDWTHVAFVKNKKTMAVYVNGIRENLYNNVSNTYNIDTNIKDGLYIGRQNSTWNTADERFVGDFGGLKISKYSRYDVTQTNIEILDFSLDTPSNTYENIIKRNDKFNIYNEAYDGISNYGYKGMMWKNYKDGYDILNVNNPNFYTYNYYKYDTNDRSIISSISNAPCGYVMFNQFGSIINNIDQDYTIFWDVYIDDRWCDLTKTPKCFKFNYAWETGFGSSQIILYYGRDSASVNRSFFTVGDGGLLNAEPVEANRIYLDFKFEPNVKYKFAISQKNHKRYYYINGVLIYTRDITNNFFVYGADLYSTHSNTELSTTGYITEIEICEKIDNIFIKVGDSFNTENYDYNNDEYDYDFNKKLDENKFADYSNIKFKTIESESLTWNKTPVVNYTNTITSSNIDSTTFAIEDINDSIKVDEFTVYLEGKRNNKNEIINILGSNYVYERLIKSPNVISKVKAFNINNNIKFINRDELIVQDKNINVVLGYLTGEVEQSACKTNALYIKVFNNRTNRHIGDYEIIDGEFKIDNLNYYDTYDVVLVDRLGKIENQTMSRRKPTPYNIYDLTASITARTIYDTALDLGNLLVLPISSLYVKDSKNTPITPTVINDTEYYIFKDSDLTYNIQIDNKEKPLFIDVMLIGGGGAGGHNNTGGGGGAGGFIRRTLKFEPNYKGSTTIKVGKGGQANPDIWGQPTKNGENTTAFDLTALGGGAGGLSRETQILLNGINGGSGGGGAGTWSMGAISKGLATDPTQGNSGEVGYIDANTYSRIGGGGGGAGSVGGFAGKGYGGNGIECDIFGTPEIFAGGGASGTNWTSGNTLGGSGIGGNGGNYSTIAPTAPKPNTGSGGAGCGEQLRSPTSGADGIVVVRVNKTQFGLTKSDHITFGINSDGKFGNIGSASVINKWELVGNTTYDVETDTFTFNGFSSYLYCTSNIDYNRDFEFSTIINIPSNISSSIHCCNILMNCINQWDTGRGTINLYFGTGYHGTANQRNKIILNTALGGSNTIIGTQNVPYDTDVKVTLKRLNNVFYLFVNDVADGQVNAWNVENRNTNAFGAWMGGNSNQQTFGKFKNLKFNYLL